MSELSIDWRNVCGWFFIRQPISKWAQSAFTVWISDSCFLKLSNIKANKMQNVTFMRWSDEKKKKFKLLMMRLNAGNGRRWYINVQQSNTTKTVVNFNSHTTKLKIKVDMHERKKQKIQSGFWCRWLCVRNRFWERRKKSVPTIWVIRNVYGIEHITFEVILTRSQREFISIRVSNLSSNRNKWFMPNVDKLR